MNREGRFHVSISQPVLCSLLFILSLTLFSSLVLPKSGTPGVFLLLSVPPGRVFSSISRDETGSSISSSRDESRSFLHLVSVTSDFAFLLLSFS